MGQRILEAGNDYRALDAWLKEQKARRVFLVCGRSLADLRIGRYFAMLEGRLGVEVVRFSDFRPNPDYASAAAAAEAFRASHCDILLGAGGGSAMDVAKCVKLWAGLEPERRYLDQAPCPAEVPFLAIPTTAGTGSEATRYAVIYDRGEKQSLSHPGCIPDAVLLDPSALENLPAYHRKSSMLDALCHGVESFWSIHAGEESRALSRQALRGIREHLEGYLQNDPAGNAGMLRAAHVAGQAIDRTQTTAGHAMAYKLTSLYGLAHGHAAALCVAKLWPFTEEKGGADLAPVFRDLAEAMGCRDSREAAQKFRALLDSLELETPRPGPGERALLARSVNPVRLGNHPVPLTEEELEGLYGEILQQEELP